MQLIGWFVWGEEQMRDGKGRGVLVDGDGGY